MVTKDQLAKIFPSTNLLRLEQLLGPLNDAMDAYDISTPLQKAAFLAQVGHESGAFRYTREIWGPTPAQERYEGRKDLGNTQPGDGKRYMGRGFIQVTGRANYKACGDALGLDLIAEPELLERIDLAALSAGWFWGKRAINIPAARGDFERVTRLVNGGLNGYADRLAIYERAKEALGA